MGEVELRIRAVDQGPDFGATGAGGSVDLALGLEVTFFGGIVKREKVRAWNERQVFRR